MIMSEVKEEMMTTPEALRYLGTSGKTFQEWRQELGIVAYRGKGNAKAYRKVDIEKIYNEKVRLRPER